MSGKGKQSSKKTVIKVRESEKSMQATLSTLENSPEAEDMSTFLTSLKTIDKGKHLPKYSAILQVTMRIYKILVSIIYSMNDLIFLNLVAA